jgi:hypothetical protein
MSLNILNTKQNTKYKRNTKYQQKYVLYIFCIIYSYMNIDIVMVTLLLQSNGVTLRPLLVKVINFF